MDYFEGAFAKSCTSIINVLLLICGFTTLIIGILDKSDLGPFSFIVHGDYKIILSVTTFVIVIGIMNIFFSIFGCISTFLNKRSLILMVGVSLCFLLVAQVAVCTILLLKLDGEDRIELKSEHILEGIFSRYYNDSTKAAKEKTDFIQLKLECCGLQNNNPFGSKRPSSCSNPFTEDNFTVSCGKQFAYKLVQSSKRLSSLMFAVITIEIFGLMALTSLYVIFHGENE